MGTKDTKGMTYYIAGNTVRNSNGWIYDFLNHTDIINSWGDDRVLVAILTQIINQHLI